MNPEPLPDPGPPKKRKAQRWVEKGHLAPWMVSYCQWLTSHPGAELSKPRSLGKGQRSMKPTADERLAKISFLLNRVVRSRVILNALEQRPDVQDYFGKCQSDAQFLAKELFREQVALNAEVRKAGLEQVAGRVVMPDGTVTYSKMDHGLVERYTRPFVDMAFPKKEAREDAPPRVILQIGGKEAQRLIAQALAPAEDIPDVEYEVVETKQLESGEDE